MVSTECGITSFHPCRAKPSKSLSVRLVEVVLCAGLLFTGSYTTAQFLCIGLHKGASVQRTELIPNSNYRNAFRKLLTKFDNVLLGLMSEIRLCTKLLCVYGKGKVLWSICRKVTTMYCDFYYMRKLKSSKSANRRSMPLVSISN